MLRDTRKYREVVVIKIRGKAGKEPESKARYSNIWPCWRCYIVAGVQRTSHCENYETFPATSTNDIICSLTLTGERENVTLTRFAIMNDDAVKIKQLRTLKLLNSRA